MKRSEALNKIEDFVNGLIDNQNIHIVEVNGFKMVGTSLDIEDRILSFVEKELNMVAPYPDENYNPEELINGWEPENER